MLLILIPKETNRLHFTMQLMLTRLLGLEIAFTSEYSNFEQYEGPKFSYGVEVDEKYLFFATNGLLSENWTGGKGKIS